MKQHLDYSFDLDLEENQDGNNLSVSVDLSGITIRDKPFRGDTGKSTGYINIKHGQLEQLIEQIKNFRSAATSVGALIENN